MKREKYNRKSSPQRGRGRERGVYNNNYMRNNVHGVQSSLEACTDVQRCTWVCNRGAECVKLMGKC